ncbi:MAG: ABC transporter permease [Bacteroidetes bacterium RIFOXYB2_FULL_35_7]|nr:MAG: ABC transporter permease [Bacteroidetes bacterium GWF2_35_48]OFY95265.1 MAG: ABC transporter permease [Bacteroidetes bacterium RIFOXYB2_FULL_35_7]OFZ04831.1 MAG: ABC transporter permease [Bacteroidetes bacterium RIFOXYC12_FULL_35_7]HBX52744.1 ABC transporter permease [Bacteroidales bacterium]
MKQIWIITKRELKAFFDSLMAYIMIVAFLGFTGFFTWLYGADVFFINQASLQSFFSISYWTLFFFIPALTMRLIAEENKSGTIELLLTKPVNDWQVVMGKFLGTLLLILIALAMTIPYYFTVSSIGKIDHGAVWSGYLGLILMSATYISIGLFASSITSNQIIAFLLAIFIGIIFHIIFDVLASSFTGLLGGIFSYLSINSHYESISRGVIDSKDLIYFLSLTFICLFSTEAFLAKRNLSK